MVTDFSEPGGDYQYENFVSNEISYQEVIPELSRLAKPGRLPGRCLRTELYVHRCRTSEGRVHFRRPASEYAAAADVQGAV